MGKYDDIINMTHHRSTTRVHMSLEDRAAQFAPFAALTGYDDEICEAHRLTAEQIVLDENQIEKINEALLKIQDSIADKIPVTINYFEPDRKKDGGKYLTVTSIIKKIDDIEHQIILDDKKIIEIKNIISIIGDNIDVLF